MKFGTFTIGSGIGDVLLHETPKSRQVSRNTGNPHHSTFSWKNNYKVRCDIRDP